MKKTILSLACMASIAILAPSCGDKKADDKDDKKTEKGDEEKKDTLTTATSSTLSGKYNYSNAKDAVNAYEEQLKKYQELIKAGNKAEAEALKLELDALKAYSESTFADQAELRALTNLAELSLKLETGGDVDLNDINSAMDSYQDILNNAASMPGGNSQDLREANEAIDKLQDMNNAMQNLDMSMPD